MRWGGGGGVNGVVSCLSGEQTVKKIVFNSFESNSAVTRSIVSYLSTNNTLAKICNITVYKLLNSFGSCDCLQIIKLVWIL